MQGKTFLEGKNTLHRMGSSWFLVHALLDTLKLERSQPTPVGKRTCSQASEVLINMSLITFFIFILLLKPAMKQ